MPTASIVLPIVCFKFLAVSTIIPVKFLYEVELYKSIPFDGLTPLGPCGPITVLADPV